MDGIRIFITALNNMDLPNIEKGMRILAQDIDRITREVRASALTSIDGGTFTRSQAGTSITIEPQYTWGDGADATSIQNRNVLNIPPLPNMSLVWKQPQNAWAPGYAADCAFRVTDVSGGGVARVQVEHHTVNTPSARWPSAMGPGQGPFLITVTETIYIYVRIAFVPNDVIVESDSTAVTVVARNALTPNTVNEEYILLAAVIFLNGAINSIINNCANATANPCNLRWS